MAEVGPFIEGEIEAFPEVHRETVSVEEAAALSARTRGSVPTESDKIAARGAGGLWADQGCLPEKSNGGKQAPLKRAITTQKEENILRKAAFFDLRARNEEAQSAELEQLTNELRDLLFTGQICAAVHREAMDIVCSAFRNNVQDKKEGVRV